MRSYRRSFFLVSLSLALAGGYALACGDSEGSGGGRNVANDGGIVTLRDAAVGGSDAAAPATTMRLAHVAADLGPVDFCYRTATSTSFDGPVLGGGIGDPKRDAGADGGANDAAPGPTDAGTDVALADGGTTNIGYRMVTRYLTLDASGPLTIAIVAPGATSCATPLFMADVTLDPGKLATVAIVGLFANDAGAGERGLVSFIDDRTVAADEARVRMINAAFGSVLAPTPGATLAVRAASAQTLTLAERVEPEKAGSASSTVPVDSLGYATISPLPSPAQLAVGAAANTNADASVTSWLSTAGELGLRGGSLHTGFILSGEKQAPYEILWCLDTSTTGALATCDLVR